MTTEETRPLLHNPEATDNESIKAANGKDVISFDPNGDPENPRDWPKSYKWSIVLLLAFTAFTVTFTCISVVPVANDIVFDLDGTNSKSASVLLVTIWEFGEAFGPLVLAPLSETTGRYPVFNVANVLFIGATILAGLCKSTPLFIAARFLTGLFTSSNVLNPAIVGDMFDEDERGAAMSAIMFAPLIGGATGPAIAGAIAQSLGWRWVLWIAVILATTSELIFLTCFRETYQVVILKRRVDTAKRATGNTALRSSFDVDNPEAGDKGSKKLRDSILRPFVVFFDSGVLVAISLFGSVEFAYFYIMSTTLPDILENIYGLSPALTGAAFIAFSVGSIVAVIITSVFLDKIYVRLREKHKPASGKGEPEYRLPLAIIGALSCPVAIALYGWSAELRLPLPVLLFNLGLLGATMLLAFLPVMSYVVDAFKRYSASAMTAAIVTRCLMGTFMPLAVDPLVKKVGYGWGFTVLCGLCLVTAPIPILLYRYGATWRQRSRYTDIGST